MQTIEFSKIDAPERLSVTMQDMQKREAGGVEAGAVGLRGGGASGVIRQLLEGIDDVPKGWWDDGIVAAHWFCLGEYRYVTQLA